jgi:hypothetical protein
MPLTGTSSLLKNCYGLSLFHCGCKTITSIGISWNGNCWNRKSNKELQCTTIKCEVGAHSSDVTADTPSLLIDNHHRFDSEMAGMNDSEDEDDDSRFEEMDTYHDVPSEIIVEGAGQQAVNGVYVRDGYFEGACKYSMQGKFNGDNCAFSLFQCNVSNNTKHWYISIVPRNSQPGTSTDIDFYSAPVLDNCTEYPPTGTWTKSNEGKEPPPKLVYKSADSAGAVEAGAQTCSGDTL